MSKPVALAIVAALAVAATTAGFLVIRVSHPTDDSVPPGRFGLKRNGPFPSINGERAVRSTARRPIAAPKLSSTFVPSSAPAIARTASQMMPTSIA